MSAWELGTVAVATVRGIEGVRVMRFDHWWASPVALSSSITHADNELTDVRPLVVIDPEDWQDRKRFRQAAVNMLEGDWPSDQALRSLIAPPKPPEPQGLGAVVEDAEGFRWTRTQTRPLGSACWERDASDVLPMPYAHITAVRVLSEGVTP